MKFFSVLLIGWVLATAASANPQSNYMIHCMGCHMIDGKGMPPEVPAFDDLLGKIVSKEGGRAYLAQVPGASQSPLNDEELAEVLTWVLRQYAANGLPENFEDISAQEVSRFRAVTLTNPAVVREELLSQK